MLFYIVVLVIVFLLVFLAQYHDERRHTTTTGRIVHSGKTAILYTCASFVLIFVAGLRYYVGSDFGAYYGGYNEYADSLFERIKTLNEPAFSFVAAISRLIIDDGGFIIFVSSLITIGLCMLTIYRNTDELLIAVMLYIFLGCWHGSFNGTRQYLATAVLFCGYRYLVDKKAIKYFLVVFLAFLCHKSAIVMFLLYPAVHLRANLKNLSLLIIFSWIVLNAYDRLFELAGWILDKEIGDTEFASTGVNIIRIVVACTPGLLFYLMIPARERTRNLEIHLNLTIIHGILAIITMNSRLLQRIILYTAAYQTIAIPVLVGRIDKYKRVIFVPAMLLLYAAFWLYEISVRSNMIPFRWLWER